MRVMILMVIFFTLLAGSQANVSAQTKQALAIDYLHGEGDLSGIRLGYRPHVTRINDAFLLGDVDLYWEMSVNFWEFGEDNSHETNYAIAISPVFSWHVGQLWNKYPLRAEFGIGVSLVDDTRFAGKDIGSHYQFEDRLGLTVEFGEENENSLSLRYMHYSNGGLNDKNPGMDFLVVSYARYL